MKYSNPNEVHLFAVIRNKQRMMELFIRLVLSRYARAKWNNRTKRSTFICSKAKQANFGRMGLFILLVMLCLPYVNKLKTGFDIFINRFCCWYKLSREISNTFWDNICIHLSMEIYYVCVDISNKRRRAVGEKKLNFRCWIWICICHVAMFLLLWWWQLLNSKI